MQFSTRITAPSTIRPKSSAPKLIRFALSRPCAIPNIVSSMESGMTHAVSSAARTLPSAPKRMAITNKAPSNRFCLTVAMVAFTRSERLYTGLINTPSGRERAISLSFSLTLLDTSRPFSPLSIRTVPSTTSRPFSVAAPVRSSEPISMDATSRTSIGIPSCTPTTISLSSA